MCDPLDINKSYSFNYSVGHYSVKQNFIIDKTA